MIILIQLSLYMVIKRWLPNSGSPHKKEKNRNLNLLHCNVVVKHLHLKFVQRGHEWHFHVHLWPPSSFYLNLESIAMKKCYTLITILILEWCMALYLTFNTILTFFSLCLTPGARLPVLGPFHKGYIAFRLLSDW